jgi:protein-S-isoprenylcysteine O-methyltransferase Ste14
MKEMQSLINKIIVRLAMLPLVLFLLVIVPAGTFNFWEAYVYFGILLIPMIYILFFFLRNDPVFLERRTRLKEKEKEQKIILVVFNLVFIAGFVIPGLDKRFGWSDVPTGIVLITDLIIFLGYMLIFDVFRQNSHASRIVEVESGQKVITTGLYSIVRHPMYLGILIMYIPTPVALGSYWGLIPMSGSILGLILRIANEEKVLRQNLEGYIEYCQRTRYRLIPFLW